MFEFYKVIIIDLIDIVMNDKWLSSTFLFFLLEAQLLEPVYNGVYNGTNKFHVWPSDGHVSITITPWYLIACPIFITDDKYLSHSSI